MPVSQAGRAGLIAAAACVLPLAVLGIALAAASSSQDPGPQAAPGTCATTTARDTAVTGQAADLSAAQDGNARIIYDVSASDHLPARAAVIAIATAMTESRLQNVDYGTSDSLGLFQQRPSQGWGPPSQIMQPAYAAQRFYSALEMVPGWQSLPLAVAAQDVQRSAYPGRYAQWQALATRLVSQFTGQAASCAADNGRGTPTAETAARLPAGFALPPGTPAPAATAIAYAAAQLGKPYIWGGTGPAGYDCSGLVMMAYRAAGIALPRTTYQQVNAGAPVYSLARLRPGDLLFTPGSDGTPENPGHVGMYIGSGLVIEAPQTGEHVQAEPLAGYWSRQTVAIRRIA